VRIRAAGNNAEAFVGQRLRQNFGVNDNLARVVAELGLHRFLKAHGLGRHNVDQRSPLHSREHDFVDGLREFGLGRIIPERGPRKVLCVVEVTMCACGTGEGCTPPATSPAKCAMSTR